jgi:hypothetical protein
MVRVESNLALLNRAGNWIARGELRYQISCQKRVSVPSPTTFCIHKRIKDNKEHIFFQ